MTSKRQRGVRVSSAKLQHALVESGLKTQTAVAERIADDEQLESVPRGLVNKVFRGEPVDPRSVERVARALGVDAWTLYISNDDLQATTPTATMKQHTAAGSGMLQSRLIKRVAVILASLLLVVVLIFQLTPDAIYRSPSETPREQPKPRTQQPTVRVLPVAAPGHAQITRSLTSELDQLWRVVPDTSEAGTGAPDAQTLLRQGSVDRVVEAHSTLTGRWLGMTVYLHQTGSMQAVWQGILPAAASQQRTDLLMRAAATAITTEAALPTYAQEAQAKYLTGRGYLDRARTEASTRRALTEFESALRIDPAFAEAYAGLCEALVMEHVRTGALDRLTEADAQCARALELAPENLEALRTQAYLDRKHGRINTSLNGFTSVLQKSPANTNALLGIADVYLTLYQRGEDDQALDKALSGLSHAGKLEPAFWKIPFTLARVHYFDDNLDAAIIAADRAVNLDANLLTLSNLGTYQYCRGDFEAARSAYLQARDLAPMSYVGEQQLAAVNYNLQAFDAAVRGFKTALDLHQQSGAAEDHRVWSNYADALRHAGQHSDAADNYAKAIALVEQDITRGDGNPSHAIARAYYYEMLSLVNPGQANLQLAALEELADLRETADSLSVMFLAIIYQLRGLPEQAEQLRTIGAQGCPGFAESPDFEL